mgnify:CR=1 FL=1
MFTSLDEALRALLKDVLMEVAKEISRSTSKAPPEHPVDHQAESFRLLRPKQAADALGISQRSLWQLTNSENLPSVRIGRLVRYDPAELKLWLQQSGRGRATTNDSDDKPSAIRNRRVSAGRTGSRPGDKRFAAASKSPSERTGRTQPQMGRAASGKPLTNDGDRRPRTTAEYFATKLGVDPSVFPELTNGEVMRIAGIDMPTHHGWAYHGREMPEEAMQRLHDFYAEHAARATARKQ